MNFDKNKARKIFLEIGVVVGVAFLFGSGLLSLQLRVFIGRTPDIMEEQITLPYEVQVMIDEGRDTIYKLRRNATNYQLALFEQLIQAHEQFHDTESDVHLKHYAGIIVRNFVADFFTLSNKNARTDVGGLQFISKNLIDDFRNVAVDEFYLYLNQLIDLYGRQALPTVEATTLLNVMFETRWIDIEDEEVTTFYHDQPAPLMEELRTIVVEIEWTYETSELAFVNEFQTRARVVLLEDEAGIRIHVIERLEAPIETQDLNSW
ncbi:MAG: hypothetical protein FWG67_04920 [Defluviitaleaceae bacterium]|nr:hypothetical protein [Defluviitaleaceae bacterium]